MKARIIHTKIWKDDFFTKLDKSSKLLFLYLLTCPEINLIGIFEIPDRIILFDTGLTQKEVGKAKEKIKGKIGFYKGYAFIKNANKYAIFTGKKNKIAKEKEFSLIPKDVIDYFSALFENFDRVSENSNRVFGIQNRVFGTQNTLSNQKPVISNQKSVISNQKEGGSGGKPDFSEFAGQAIAYLNKRTGKSFTANNKATIGFLMARFNEGRTLEDLRLVIDNRADKWLKDEKMQEYLRPSTLFNLTKFEGYLVEARTEQAKNIGRKKTDEEYQKELQQDTERAQKELEGRARNERAKLISGK